MPPKSSLAALLGELNSAAPADYDPEAGYDLSEAHQRAADANSEGSISGSEDDGQDDFHNPRAHYVDMGESSLRKKSNLSEHDKLRDPKYQGVKATRAQLYSQDDDAVDGLDVLTASDAETEEADEQDEEDEDDEEEDEGDEDDDETEDDDEGDEEEGIHGRLESEEGQADSDPDDFANLLRSSSKARPAKSLRFAQDEPEATSARSQRSGDKKKSDGEAQDDDDGEVGNSIASQLNQSQKLAKQLRARRLEDAEKGRNVRKQIRLWERSLEARIKAQSALKHLNQLPDPAVLSDWLSSSSSSGSTSSASLDLLGGTLEELLALSDRLFEVRTKLHKLNDPSSATKLDAGSRKRKRQFGTSGDAEELAARIGSLGTETSGDDDVLSASIADLVGMEIYADASRRPVLEKWSHKVSSAAASASSSNKFALKAVNRSPVAQIDAAMSADGYERLLERTRVLRTSGAGGNEGKIGAILSEPDATANATSTTVGGVAGRQTDPEVFDDTDFYSFLLRELIERRASSASAGTTATALSNELYSINSKKNRRNGANGGGVDTKASKGRRLRYDVNEKIVAFMPPIPSRVKWTSEQIDRLFSQLASRSMADERPEDEEVDENDKVELAGLRVFG